MGIALILILPNFIWQYTHHFPVLHHMRELTETQLQYVSVSSFLTDQVMMFFPCFMVWMAGLVFLLISRQGREYIFLVWAYMGVIAILIYFHGKSYYALGLYPLLLGFGAYALEKWTSRRLYFLRYVICCWAFLFGIYTVFIALPVQKPARLAHTYIKMHAAKTGALRWEDLKNHPLPQDFADMLGWEEMAQKTGAAYHTLSEEEKKETIVFGDNYGMTGAINFYRKKYKLPEAYSDNASFLYWLPDHLPVKNVVLITDDQEEMQHDFIKDFTSAILYDSITSPYAREHGDLIIILKGANDEFRKFFREKIERDKQKLMEY
jgi:hypothetical protein